MIRTTAVWLVALSMLCTAVQAQELPTPFTVQAEEGGESQAPPGAQGQSLGEAQPATGSEALPPEWGGAPASATPTFDPYELFPLAGFVPLPGEGRLDPYNLGITWGFDTPEGPSWVGTGRERSSLAGRFGWWGTSTTGSATKVGEWQSLSPSAFWDIDGLQTTGDRTFNFFATGLDNDTTQGMLQYYGPLMRARIDAQQFLHRLDHDPINNIANRPLPVPAGFSGIYKTDLNAGDNYAIRVEQLNGEMVTYLADNVKFRVQFFGMKKFGDRQAEALAHCFQARGVAGRNCHLLSQTQHIDWTTAEVTPRLEATFGPVTFEYARLMRQFTQNDQVVTRDYNGTSPALISGTYPYAVVPDITTQMDQFRVNWAVADKTRFYGFGYFGRMDNYNRDIERNFSGYDVRLTDYTLDGVMVTAYAKGYHQTGNSPSVLLTDELQGLTPTQARENIRAPIEYHRTSAGLRNRYMPYLSAPLFSHLAFTGGYEYDYLGRNNAIWQTSGEEFTFNQPSTITNTLYVGVQQPWTATVDSYARYRVNFISNPLYGFRETSGVLNSGLPQQRHVVEVGGGWYPLANLGLSARQEVDVGWHDANISEVPGNVPRFNQQSYSTNLTLWYAPTPRLALVGSAAFMSNWIDQNITLGDDYVEPGAPNVGLLNPVTLPWFYGGRSSIFTARADYRWTPTVRVYAGYEFVHGNDAIQNRNFTSAWGNLGDFSQVINDTHRVLAGLDWKPTELMSVYLRYTFFEYDEANASYNNGTAHMVMAGLTLIR